MDRFDADSDPGPDFHVDTHPDRDPDRHQNNADPHTDPTPSFTLVGKSEFFFYF